MRCVLCDWLPFLGRRSSRVAHVGVGIRASFPLWTDHSTCIHPSIRGHLGGFHFWGYGESRCYEHLCTNFCADVHFPFFGIYTQKCLKLL